MNIKFPVIMYGIFLCLCLTGCNRNEHESQGYVEGEYRYMAANFAGVLHQLPVARGAQVKQGDLLFELDPQPESAALKQAEQQVQQIQAQIQQDNAGLALAQIELKRQQVLIHKGATDKDSLDKARTNFIQSQAQLAQAQANLRNVQAALTQAQWSHQQKTVTAPVSALVFDTYYLPGELVPAGYPVLSLLAPQDVKIIFYVNEPELSQLKLNQTININCDNCVANLDAKINFISPQAEYTPPVIYSDDTRDKLVYRIEAKPTLAQAMQLHPGQPVEVSWDR